MVYKNNEAGQSESTYSDSLDVYSRLIERRVIFLKDEIDAEVATKISATLFWLNAQDPTEEITLYINSPGGTVSDGLFTIYDTMQYIEAPVCTICIGEACSGAAVILASGAKGRRLAYPSAQIMIHSIQVSEMSGTEKEIQEEAKRIKDLNQTLMQIISKHTKQSIRKVRKDCEFDKYLSSEEALKYGLIDKIIRPNRRKRIKRS